MPRQLDARYKLSPEQEDEILKMRRDDGHAYKYIADKFKVNEHTVYYLCQKVLNPDIYKRRKEIKRLAQIKYSKSISKEKKLANSRAEYKKQVLVKGEQLRMHEAERSLHYWRTIGKFKRKHETT